MKIDTLQAIRGKLDPDDLLHAIKYNIDFKKEHPDWFLPDGIIVFTGSQGQGKTLSAVRYIDRLMRCYPKAMLCSNVFIKGYDDRFVFFDGVRKFKEVDNGEYGVIYFIDEIQLLFNSLESRQMDLNLFTTICQQRKKRKHIVGTSQVFNRISKGFREQFKYAVMCNKVFGFLQWNKVVRGEDCQVDENGKVQVDKVYHSIFFHSPELYDMYDTYAAIDRTKFNFEWEDLENVPSSTRTVSRTRRPGV